MNDINPVESLRGLRKFKPYPAYKDSDAEWLGKVPAHWEITRVKRVASLRAGMAITSESIEETGDYPVFGGNGIRGFASSYNHEGEFPLIGRQGALCGCVNFASGKFWASEHAVVASPLHYIESRWLAYLLRAMSLNSYSESAAQPGLAVDTISALPVAQPLLHEQRAIAAFLDRETTKIDALVAKKERLIELLQEKRAALITRAVTKGLDPNVAVKDSGVEWLGEIPAHWDVQKLKRICSITYGLSLELDRTAVDGTPIISLPNVSLDGNLDLTETAVTVISDQEKKELLLRPGDLLFNWRNGSSEHVGKTALFEGEGEFIHVSFLLRLRFDPVNYSSRYFQRYLNSLRFTGFFSSTKAGVNNTFNQSELQELEVPVPPHTEQSAIADFIRSETSEADSLVKRIRDGVEKLKEYRTALISAAVTGKIDVREEAT